VIRKIVLLLLIAVPLAAQDAPAQFFIERIEVRNHQRVSPDVVIAESRLREGRAYSEDELHDAAARLARLPFLLSVDFALEKGSERGRHVLVLAIHETRPFFYLLDLQPYFNQNESTFSAEDDRVTDAEDLAVGFRWFVGRRGAIHLGLTGMERNREFSREFGGFAVGYTQYDLFGTRAFATLNLKHALIANTDVRVSPQIVLGVPLAANQTVTLQYDELRYDGDDRGFDRGYHQRIVSARWSHNTTNEPFFPTRGTLLQAGPVIGWTDDATVESFSTEGPRIAAHHSRFAGVETGATRYWELSDRDSVWGDARFDWTRGQFRDTLRPDAYYRTHNYGSVGVGYARSLWSREERANGDSRFEVTARYSNRTRRDYPTDVPGYEPQARDLRQFGAAWIRRSAWGTVRLGAGYAW
ncbi:MAG TPA: hypothetical protein VND45_05080, partial [Thermoanaerobaculia bacterium]|nr:hypothetical protein [Thermoanaerobaculia bacterium]